MDKGFEGMGHRLDRRYRFDVERDRFEALEIRKAPDSNFYYFYDTDRSQLIKDFILYDGPRVMTLCTIFDGYEYSPRFKFWKADKRAIRPGTDTDEPQDDDILPSNVKAMVDVAKASDTLLKLVNYLQSCQNVTVPLNTFKIVSTDAAAIAEAISNAPDKETVLRAVSTAFAGNITQRDLDLIANRKGQVDRFQQLLTDEAFFESERAAMGKSRDEAVWQAFFEENPWIFGYGLSLIFSETIGDRKLEQITSGAGLLSGAGKRVDAILKFRSVIGGLLFVEIKKHTTGLLSPRAYRPPDVYSPSTDLSGAVAQVQKTTDKFVRQARSAVQEVIEPDGTRTGIEISTVRPRQVVVVGRSLEFVEAGGLNPERVSSFELYRRSILDTEIVTFDELFDRARFIVSGE